MGYHSFAAGEVLTAANVNTYLMNQVVIVCTSTTRPSSPVNGMMIYETDTSDFRKYNGTTWVVLAPSHGWSIDSHGSLTITQDATATGASLFLDHNANGISSIVLAVLKAGSGQSVDMMRLNDSAGNVNLVLDKNQHLTGVGTAPTGAAGANAGGSPPSPVMGGSDQGGTCTFGTGTTPAAGAMVVVTFNRAFNNTPRVTLTAQNSATALLGQPYVSSLSTTGFTINVPNAPAASQANTIYGYRWTIT